MVKYRIDMSNQEKLDCMRESIGEHRVEIKNLEREVDRGKQAEVIVEHLKKELISIMNDIKEIEKERPIRKTIKKVKIADIKKRCSRCCGETYLGKDQNGKYWIVCKPCDYMEEF